MRSTSFCALAIALAFIAPAAAETLQSPRCRNSLDQALASTDVTRAQLLRLGNLRGEEICRAARTHFVEMVKARAVTAACKTGADREKDLRRLDEAVEGINGVIAERCGS